MLQTPFGTVEILFDGKPLAYSAELLEPEKNCPDITGRYGITVTVSPDGKPHALSCILPALPAHAESSAEPGEQLELISFYADGTKLSVGLAADNSFDFACAYPGNGMTYLLLPRTKTDTFTFGIAWIGGVPAPDAENPRDVQTWFAADPTLFRRD